jgi:hypothetical protein
MPVSSVWTQFSSSLFTRDTDWGQFFSMSAPPAPPETFFAMDPLLLIPFDEEPSLHGSFRAGSPGYEILEFRKHRKGAHSCSDWFRRHRDPVGAQIAEESRPI